MWDSLLGLGNAKSLTFSPEIGWGQGPAGAGGPGWEPPAGMGGQSPCPSPTAELPGPLLPFARDSPFPREPQAGITCCFPPPASCPFWRERPGPSGPCHLRPPVWLRWPLSGEAGVGVGKSCFLAASPGPGSD